MIGTVSVRVSVARTNMPLEPVTVFAGSAATVGVIDVPKVKCGVEVTGVGVSLTNADGVTQSVNAKLVSGVWCATFPSSHFTHTGFTGDGLQIVCGGTDENDVVRAWKLGVGDVTTAAADPSAVPADTSFASMKLRDAVPTAPVKGDFAVVNGRWSVWTGTAWSQVSDGSGEMNVIEKVQKNGVDLPITNKTVNVTGIPTIASTTALLAGDGSGNAVAHTLTAAEIPSLDAAKITSGTIAAARLPVATSAARGAVMPAAKDATMTQAVGVDANGALWTAAGGGGGGDQTGGFVVYIGSISSANLTQLNFADGTSEVLENGTHNKVWEHVVSLTLNWPSDVQMTGLSESRARISFGGKVYCFGGGNDNTTYGFHPLGIGLMDGYVGTFPLTASMCYGTIICGF